MEQKIKIDLSGALTDLEGKEASTISAGRILAEYLMSVTSSDFHALFGVAMKLVEDKPIEVTVEEHKRLVDLVEKGNMQNIMKVRIMESLKFDSE